MAEQRPNYLSYLLRLWRTGGESEGIWRASLQRPGSEERHGFASLEEMVGFLETQTRQIEQDAEGGGDP